MLTKSLIGRFSKLLRLNIEIKQVNLKPINLKKYSIMVEEPLKKQAKGNNKIIGTHDGKY